MRKLFWLAVLAILSYFLYFKLDSLGYLNPDHPLHVSLCDNPIHYRIESIDPKFGITQKDLLADLQKATNLWEKDAKRKLFVYDPTGDLKISMVYDTRQQLTTEISDLKKDVKTSGGALKSQISSYETQVEEFRQKISAFNAEVESWNAKGGAPEDEYKKLKATQEELQQQAEKLNQLAKTLNISTGSYNNEVGKLNSTVDKFNQTIEIKPEEGVFKGPENSIEIYFTTSNNELVHTLAHELGHARGLDHNPNPKSIMYPSTATSLKPTEEDLNDLSEVCKPLSIFEIAGYNAAVFVNRNLGTK